jgi:hypothetical protein
VEGCAKEKKRVLTQRAQRKSREVAEKENPRAQPGMAVPQEESYS